MEGILKFKKIKPRMIFWIFTAVLLPVLIVCTTIYFQRVTAIKTEAYSKLSAIRDLKVGQLNIWLEERRSDLEAIAMDSEVQQVAGVFARKEANAHDRTIISSTRNILHSFVENDRAYHEMFIINGSTGIVEISTEKDSEGLNVSREPYYIESLKTGSFFIRDIYYSKNLNRPAMCFAMPINGLNSKRNKAFEFSILVVRIDLEHSLYDLLLERSGMGKTGETLIIDKNQMALNDLRWHDHAPLKLKIGAKPAILASQGNVGVIEAKDYRQIDVLASYTYLPRTRWGFVAKQDLSEIYAPIGKMLKNIAIILLISIVFAYALALMLARYFSNPIIEFTKVANRIQAGDLSARSTFRDDNEYGMLSHTFNGMAESIETYREIQNALRDLDKILVTSTTMDDFGEKFIREIVETTGSDFGSFYLVNRNENSFKHIFSTGFDMELMNSLDEKVLMGAFEKALTTQKTTYVNEITADTIFTINTIAGTALPRCIATIPILSKKQVLGIIAIGSLTDYPESVLEILEQVQTGTGTALSNILSGEKTSAMAKMLETKNIELEAQSQELQAMTDDLKQQNIELDAQSRQLEVASRLKSEFLSNMSHELRTPLNSVMALSSVLKTNAAQKLDEEEIEYLDVIKRNGKRLLDLINDILDLSKIEAGHMDVALSFFRVETTVEDIVNSLGPMAQKKNISFRTEISENLPKIQSDEKRVHQILLNLIGNAVKFTEKGEVTVTADISNDKIALKVSDTGIGIAGKDLASIFEEFQQVDGSTSRRHEGTGLGLAIAFKASKKLGGDLSVASKPGQGATFTLTLPVKWQGESEQVEPLNSISQPEVTEDLKTVLVVDDDPKTLDLISGYISREGYNTLTATSGPKALSLAKAHRPFAITLDLIMPEMDGFETLQHLKNDPETSNIPVIIVSVSSDGETGLTLGAVGYVAKPVIRNELIKEIEKACSKPVSIMMADDSELDRKTVREMLTPENMQVIEAENGRVCIEKIREAVPDILILDMMMPEMGGFDVLEVLRNDALTASLPVIIVTAKDLSLEEKNRLNQYAVSVFYKSSLTSQSLLKEIGNNLKDIESRTPPDNIPLNRPGKRILVVEDNKVSIIQIKMILEQQGYTVDTATGGKQAQDFVTHTIPDAIILDLMMPDVDGFAVLERIRSTKETAQIPVLILTAKDLTPDDYKKLSTNNVQQLIQKGDVEREELIFKVSLMLGENPAGENPAGEKTTISNPAPLKTRITVKKTENHRYTVPVGLPRVLVIEDNPDNMITIKAVLKDKYTVIEAIDGETGLKAALEHLPDLVLLDISLPGMDGYEVIKEIKANEQINQIPVIALTAHAMKGDRDKIISAGCDDYLSKPIDPEKILETLERRLKEF